MLDEMQVELLEELGLRAGRYAKQAEDDCISRQEALAAVCVDSYEQSLENIRALAPAHSDTRELMQSSFEDGYIKGKLSASMESDNSVPALPRITRVSAYYATSIRDVLPVKAFIDSEISKGGIIVDTFAGTVRNGVHIAYETHAHLEGLAFLCSIGTSRADLVLCDFTRMSENSSDSAKYKDEIQRILKPGGRVICCGTNTSGLGSGRGFEMTELLICSYGEGESDTFVTLEIKKECGICRKDSGRLGSQTESVEHLENA